MRCVLVRAMLRTALARGVLARSRATAVCRAAALRRGYATPGDFDLIADEQGSARVEGCAPAPCACHAPRRACVTASYTRHPRGRACCGSGCGAPRNVLRRVSRVVRRSWDETGFVVSGVQYPGALLLYANLALCWKPGTLEEVTPDTYAPSPLFSALSTPGGRRGTRSPTLLTRGGFVLTWQRTTQACAAAAVPAAARPARARLRQEACAAAARSRQGAF